jgi:hypothetical protein
MKHPLLLLIVLLIASSSTFGQVSSTNGTFTATTPSNLSLQAGATPTTRLTILNSNGNIGINTTAPADWLHVNGNVRANQFNTVNGIFNTTAAATNMSFNTNGTNRMTLLSGGNFGIGTATPARLLTVVAASPVISIQNSASNDASVKILRFANATDGLLGSLELYGGSGEFRMNAVNSFFPTFYSNGVEAMRINTAGNIGIGTTTPAYKLDINGTINANGGAYVANESGAPRVAIGGPAGEYGSIGFGYKYVNGGGYTYSVADWGSQLMFDVGGFTFRSAGVGSVGAPVSFNPLMKVLNNGNVGIGTIAPTGKLHIVHGGTSNGSNPAIQIESTTAANLGAAVFKNDFGDEGMVGITGSSYSNGMRGSRATILTNNTPGGIVVNSDNPNASIVFGTGGSAVANERMRIYNNGNVGIGTATPNYKLDVAGAINATSILVNGAPISGGGAGSWTPSANNYTTGNVGIGTSAPTAKLNIVYTGNTDPTNQAIQIETTNAANYAAINLKNSSGDLGQFGLTGSSYNWGLFQPNQTFINSSSPNGILLDAYDPNGFISFGTGGAAIGNERIRIDKLGNVGIGISNPSQILHVHQAVYAGMRTTTNLTGSTINDGVNFGYDDSYGAYIWNRENSPIIFSTNNIEQVRVTANGNVGIGTTTPNAAYKLDVAGAINATSILVNGTPISGGGASQWATNGSDISYAAGNVGIGTASPRGQFDVAGSGDIYLSNNPIAGTTQSIYLPGHLFLAPYGGTDWTYLQARRSDNSGSTNLMFRTWNAGTMVQPMAILSNGNVGIGTINPDAKLAVKGTVHAQEVKIDLAVPAPDYVFEKDYHLMSLEDTKAYIEANKHLPEVPSAKEMEKNGVQLGEMNMLLLKKVEELTLNLIAINERLKQIENENRELKKGIENKK